MTDTRSQTQIDALHRACRYLTDLNPDWASEQNGVGWNKPDSVRGFELADIPATVWNPEDVHDAAKILRKYARTQLADFDLGLDSRPEIVTEPDSAAVAAWTRANPDAAAARREALVRHNPTKYGEPARYRLEMAPDGNLRLFSPRNMAFVNEMKRVIPSEYRRFTSEYTDHKTLKYWTIKRHPSVVEPLRALIAPWNLVTDERVDATLALWASDAPVAAAAPAMPVVAAVAHAGTVTIEGDTLVFKRSYSNAFVDAIKELPRHTRRFQGSDLSWRVPVNADAPVIAQALDVARRFDLEIDAAVTARFPNIEEVARVAREQAEQEAAAAEVRKNANLEQATALDADVDTSMLLRQPFGAFQRVGIRFLLDNLQPHRGVLLADDMGLGKTYESLAAMHIKGAYPLLVISPASVKYNWEREINLTIPGVSVQVVNGKPIKPGSDVVIINYDLLKREQKRILAYGFQGMIGDEFHAVKNHKALRTKLVGEIAKTIPFLVGLTGTPVLNRPTEMASPLTILGRLNDVGGWGRFMYHYCMVHQGEWGLESPDPRTMSASTRAIYEQRLADLNREMRAHFYIRREKRDVLDLPERINSLVPVTLTNRREYDDAADDILSYVGRLAEQDDEFNASIAHLPADEQARLRREHRNDAENRAARAEVLVRINNLKQLAARGKLDATKDYVQSFLDAGRKVVIMAWHQEIVQELAATFNAPSITGKVDAETRQRFVEEFQTNPECMVIACNILAGGEGITLTAASDVVFVELPWNPGKLDQAIDRLNRIGQHENVTAHFLLGRDSIDQAMYQLIQGKRRVTSTSTTGETQELEATVGDLEYLITAMREGRAS